MLGNSRRLNALNGDTYARVFSLGGDHVASTRLSPNDSFRQVMRGVLDFCDSFMRKPHSGSGQAKEGFGTAQL